MVSVESGMKSCHNDYHQSSERHWPSPGVLYLKDLTEHNNSMVESNTFVRAYTIALTPYIEHKKFRNPFLDMANFHHCQ